MKTWQIIAIVAIIILLLGLSIPTIAFFGVLNPDAFLPERNEPRTVSEEAREQESLPRNWDITCELEENPFLTCEYYMINAENTIIVRFNRIHEEGLYNVNMHIPDNERPAKDIGFHILRDWHNTGIHVQSLLKKAGPSTVPFFITFPMDPADRLGEHYTYSGAVRIRPLI